MNPVNYLQFLEPMQDQFTKVYSTMSGIIAVILVLWILNFIAGMTQRTYWVGKAFGGFYRHYIHRYFKRAFLKVNYLLKKRREEPAS